MKCRIRFNVIILMVLASAAVVALGVWTEVDALALVALAGTVVGGCVAISQKLVDPDPVPPPEKEFDNERARAVHTLFNKAVEALDRVPNPNPEAGAQHQHKGDR